MFYMRRGFIAGTGGGAAVLALAGCTVIVRPHRTGPAAGSGWSSGSTTWQLVTQSFRAAMTLAIVLGITASVGGVVTSFYEAPHQGGDRG